MAGDEWVGCDGVRLDNTIWAGRKRFYGHEMHTLHRVAINREFACVIACLLERKKSSCIGHGGCVERSA